MKPENEILKDFWLKIIFKDPWLKYEAKQISSPKMAFLKTVPRSCKIERKEFVLSLDKYSRSIHYWLTEIGAHKSFSIEVSLSALDWIRSTMKTLIATPSSNHFLWKQEFRTLFVD